MHTRSKLMLAGLAASLMLAVAVPGSLATSLRLSGRSFSITWRSFTVHTGTGLEVADCQVTLSGSFHSTVIRKTAGLSIGSITSATDGAECDELEPLAETLPWDLRYRSFTGSLPRIESVRVDMVGVALTLLIFIDCLITTEAEEPLGGRFVLNQSGQVTSYVPDDFRIDITDELLCPIAGDITHAGTATVSPTLTFTLV